MKKLFIVALLVVGMTSFAQERKARPERAQMEQMTPEQRNQLHLKKMTLELDLNASQQKEMSKIIAEQSAKREAKMAERKASKDSAKKQLTADELFAKKSKMLDEQIVMKERMKKILTPEQYKKWDDMKGKRHHGMKKRMMHHKDGKPAEMGDKK
jgi:Spy/CpxP family protein refolding chaperone